MNQPVDLSVELAGLKLSNPTILASGILGLSWSLLKRVEEAGAGAVTTKTITLDPKKGYDNPVIVDLGYGYVNAIGLSNPGVDEYTRELIEGRKRISVPIIASVGGSSVSEFVRVAERILEAKVNALELNLSCPHVKGMGLQVSHDLNLSIEVVRGVKGISSLPVFVKISPETPNYISFVEKCIEAGVDGVTAINTIKALAVDVNAKKPILSNVFGGLSGKCIKPIALRVVYEIHESFRDIPIIGVGGIYDWRDAVEFILAGATAIGLGSAIAERDVYVFKEVCEGISQYLVRNGLKSIKELIGFIHRR